MARLGAAFCTKRVILAVLVTAVGALTVPGALAGPVGNAIFVDGDVQISTRSGDKRPLMKGEVINEGDTVITGPKASIQVKMADGGMIAVRPDTQLKFDIFTLAQNKGDPQNSVISLIEGSMRAITGLIGKNNKQEYKVNTVVGTIGIRGTDHEAAFIPKGSPSVPAGAYSKVNVGQIGRAHV